MDYPNTKTRGGALSLQGLPNNGDLGLKARSDEYLPFRAVKRCADEAAKPDPNRYSGAIDVLDWNRRVWTRAQRGLQQPRKRLARRRCSPRSSRSPILGRRGPRAVIRAQEADRPLIDHRMIIRGWPCAGDGQRRGLNAARQALFQTLSLCPPSTISPIARNPAPLRFARRRVRRFLPRAPGIICRNVAHLAEFAGPGQWKTTYNSSAIQ